MMYENGTTVSTVGCMRGMSCKWWPEINVADGCEAQQGSRGSAGSGGK